jgi:hypothetical protein
MTQVHSGAPGATSLNPVGFDSVSVVAAAVSGPDTANRLYTVTGVALFSGLVGNSDSTWAGYDVVFLVPAAGETRPVETGGQAFVPGIVHGSTVTVLQATFQNSKGGSTAGWGVDRASCAPVGDLIQVKASAVELGTGAATWRLTFSLTVLATV